MSARHTPTPWKLEVVRRNGDDDGYEIYSEDGCDISTDNVMLKKDNAAFIVQAVNNHEALRTICLRYLSSAELNRELERLRAIFSQEVK